MRAAGGGRLFPSTCRSGRPASSREQPDIGNVRGQTHTAEIGRARRCRCTELPDVWGFASRNAAGPWRPARRPASALPTPPPPKRRCCKRQRAAQPAPAGSPHGRGSSRLPPPGAESAPPSAPCPHPAAQRAIFRRRHARPHGAPDTAACRDVPQSRPPRGRACNEATRRSLGPLYAGPSLNPPSRVNSPCTMRRVVAAPPLGSASARPFRPWLLSATCAVLGGPPPPWGGPEAPPGHPRRSVPCERDGL